GMVCSVSIDLLVRNYSTLSYAGLTVIGALWVGTDQIQSLIANSRSDLSTGPWGKLAGGALNSIQPQWGCGVLIVGAVLWIAADWGCIWRRRPARGAT